MNKYLFVGLAILLYIASGEELEEPNAAPVKKGPCDETRECIRYDFTGTAKALCWGYYGCKGASFETSQNAVCSGSGGCLRGKFDGTQPSVRCNGFRSCVRARGMGMTGLYAVNDIHCNGFQTCTAVVGGLNAPKLYCDGDLACSNSKSNKADTALKLYGSDLVYCNGNGACKEDIITSDTYVYCDGKAACKNTRVQAPKLDCLGMRTCYNSTLQVDELDAFGWFSALNTTITSPSIIKAYGFNSLAMAEILTRGTHLDIYAYGFRAMAGAYIDVTQGSIVTLTCKNNACKGVPIYVAKNSDFSVDPPACDPTHADYEEAKKDGVEWGAKVEGVHCPWIQRAGNNYEGKILTDDDLQVLKAQYLIDRELTEEFEEMMDLMDLEDAKWEKYIEDRLEDYADVVPDAEVWDDLEDEQYFVGGTIMGVQAQEYSSGLLLSNLLTALAAFMITSGLIYCIVSYKQQQFNYKALPQ